MEAGLRLLLRVQDGMEVGLRVVVGFRVVEGGSGVGNDNALAAAACVT